MVFHVVCRTRDETGFDNPPVPAADDLAGQPPATVIVDGLDPLRDEDRARARKQGDAGVTVELIRHADRLHGCLLMPRIIGAEVERAREDCGRVLAGALAAAPP